MTIWNTLKWNVAFSIFTPTIFIRIKKEIQQIQKQQTSDSNSSSPLSF